MLKSTVRETVAITHLEQSVYLVPCVLIQACMVRHHHWNKQNFTVFSVYFCKKTCFACDCREKGFRRRPTRKPETSQEVDETTELRRSRRIAVYRTIDGLVFDASTWFVAGGDIGYVFLRLGKSYFVTKTVFERNYNFVSKQKKTLVLHTKVDLSK